MQKAIRHILPVMGRILFIGLSFQVILGLAWIIGNLGRFQEFGDSYFYLEVSESLLFDEYTGALYPALLMLVRGIEGLLHIPYTYVMHLLQLGAAGYAGYFLLDKVGVERCVLRIWGSLVLLTFPMIVQCHLAILPNSLAFSALIMELALVLEAVRKEESLRCRQLFYINLFWLIEALLLPDYLYFGAVPAVLMLCRDFRKYRKQVGKRYIYHCILVAAFVGMIVGISDLTQQEGAYGRPAKSVESSLFRRVTWINLYDYYEVWPQELQAVCDYDFVEEVARYADEMERMLQPQIETVLGEERAQELYWEAAKTVFAYNKRNIVHAVVWDVVSYTVPPIATQMLLEGRGNDSYVGRNYEIMRQKTPGLTKWYVDYSCWWFAVGIGVALVTEVLLLCCKRKFRVYPPIICIVTAAVFVGWYVMQGAGIWDYKNAPVVVAIWGLWMILQISRTVDEE